MQEANGAGGVRSRFLQCGDAAVRTQEVGFAPSNNSAEAEEELEAICAEVQKVVTVWKDFGEAINAGAELPNTDGLALVEADNLVAGSGGQHRGDWRSFACDGGWRLFGCYHGSVAAGVIVRPAAPVRRPTGFAS